jgi:hypothetical protein
MQKRDSVAHGLSTNYYGAEMLQSKAATAIPKTALAGSAEFEDDQHVRV